MYNPQEIMFESLRRKRDQLLYESDWTQLGDAPLTDSKKQEWVTYRQALRDVTEGFDPSGITNWNEAVCESYMPAKPTT